MNLELCENLFFVYCWWFSNGFNMFYHVRYQGLSAHSASANRIYQSTEYQLKFSVSCLEYCGRARELKFVRECSSSPHVICHFFQRNLWSLLVEGLLSTKPTPSSFPMKGKIVFFFLVSFTLDLSEQNRRLGDKQKHRNQRIKQNMDFFFLPANSVF